MEGVLNSRRVENLFRSHSMYIIEGDVITADNVEELLGKDALKFAIQQNKCPKRTWGNYGIGYKNITYLTHYGFQVAATYYNIKNR